MDAKATGVSGALFNSSAPFVIGRRPDGTSNDCNGWIDEIRGL